MENCLVFVLQRGSRKKGSVPCVVTVNTILNREKKGIWEGDYQH